MILILSDCIDSFYFQSETYKTEISGKFIWIFRKEIMICKMAGQSIL